MPVCLKYCILGGEAVALGRRREQEEEENMAVAEPEFTCTHDIYTFTYMIVFTFIFCFTCVYQVPVPYAIPVY
jgi:hypothetical protein